MSALIGAYKSINSNLRNIYGRGTQVLNDSVNSVLKPVEDAADGAIGYVTKPIVNTYTHTRDDLVELSRRASDVGNNLIFGLEVSTAVIAVAGVLVLVYVGKKVL